MVTMEIAAGEVLGVPLGALYEDGERVRPSEVVAKPRAVLPGPYSDPAVYGQAVRAAREARGWTRERFAAELGVSLVTAERLEEAGERIPTRRAAGWVADNLGVYFAFPERLIDPDLPWDEDERAQYVVAAHPSGISLSELGSLIGLTRERVRQIEFQAIGKLQRWAEANPAFRDELRDMLRRRMSEMDEPTVYVDGTPPSQRPLLTGGTDKQYAKRKG